MDDDSRPEHRTGPWLTARRKLAFAIVLAVLLALLLPPWININRFKRDVAASIASSLGRPVRMDRVGLRLLPSPAFAIDNFVVGEDPAFGAEPVVRAATVIATLHISSLWRGRLEFASIDLEEPSVDLVRNPYGKWNLEGILFQAARIATAPTSQRRASSLPRFPYIQAENARINIKMGDEKIPLSFTEAKFALWLSAPGHWQMQIEGRPIRSDLEISDIGTLRVEGDLQVAPTLAAIPLTLQLNWQKAQLGEVTRLLTGKDMGWRGALEATGQIAGTVGDAQFQLHASVTGLRREEFFPEASLDLSVDCAAAATGNLSALSKIHCVLPLATGSVDLDGSVADLKAIPEPNLDLNLRQIPAQTLLTALRHASNRIAPGLTAEGALDGTFHYGSPATQPEDTPSRKPVPPALFRATTGSPTPVGASHGGLSGSEPSLPPRWQGRAVLPVFAMNAPGWSSPLVLNNLQWVAGESAPQSLGKTRSRRSSSPSSNPGSARSSSADGDADAGGLSLLAASLPLGTPQPAVLTARFSRDGYAFHIAGDAAIARLLELDSTLHLLDSALPALQPAGTAGLDLDLRGPWSVPSQEAIALLPDAFRPQQSVSVGGDLQLKSALLRPAFASSGSPPAEVAPSSQTQPKQVPGPQEAEVPDATSAQGPKSAFTVPEGDIGVTSARLVLGQGTVAWLGVVALYNGVRYQGDVSVPTSCSATPQSLPRAAGSPEAAPSRSCAASFDLSTPAIDFGSVAASLNLRQAPRKSLLDLFSQNSAAPPPWPTAQGTLRIAALNLGPLVLRNALVRLSTEGSRATVDSLTADLLAGTMVAHGNVVLGRPAAAYEVDAALSNVSLAAAATLFHEKWGSGTGEAHCALRLAGADFAALRQSATGNCDWLLRRGVVSVVSPAQSAGDASHRTTRAFQQWQARASLANGVLKLEPGDVVSAQGTLPISGTIGLDRAIDLQWGDDPLQGWLDGAGERAAKPPDASAANNAGAAHLVSGTWVLSGAHP